MRKPVKKTRPRRRGPGRRIGAVALAVVVGWPAIPAIGPGLSGGGDLAAQQVDERGIRVVGRFDPATGETAYEAAEPLGGLEVLAVQRGLLRAGVSPGSPDGRMGPATRAALERFQRERGLRPCGCVSYETVLALGLEPRVTRVVVGAARPGGDEGSAVRVLRPRGIPAAAGGLGRAPAAPTGAGPAAGESAEPDAPALRGYDAAGYWIPVIVPGGPPLPPPGEGAMPRPGPRGVTPPGIRPAPPPRVSPPGSSPRSNPPPRRSGSGSSA